MQYERLAQHRARDRAPAPGAQVHDGRMLLRGRAE